MHDSSQPPLPPEMEKLVRAIDFIFQPLAKQLQEQGAEVPPTLLQSSLPSESPNQQPPAQVSHVPAAAEHDAPPPAYQPATNNVPATTHKEPAPQHQPVSNAAPAAAQYNNPPPEYEQTINEAPVTTTHTEPPPPTPSTAQPPEETHLEAVMKLLENMAAAIPANKPNQDQAKVSAEFQKNLEQDAPESAQLLQQITSTCPLAAMKLGFMANILKHTRDQAQQKTPSREVQDDNSMEVPAPLRHAPGQVR